MHVFLKFLFKFRGYDLDGATKELKRIHGLSPEEVKLHQAQKCWEIFQFHMDHNPHYKQWVGSKEINTWTDIPILTKSDLQAPLKHRFSQGYNEKNTFLNNTSGSSGTPFYFAKDKYAHSMTWAVVIDRFGRHGIQFGKHTQARFYGIPAAGFKYYKEKVKDFFGNRVRFPVFDLSDEKLAEFEKVMAKKRFHYVNGYTSSLVLFAKYLISQNKSAKSICPSLQVVFPTSEMCNEADRRILEQGFGVKVVNEYGATELDLIAMDDENGDWILNHETLFIELLDDNNNPVEPGQSGKVVVTSLYNRAMPFIRYELGDIGVISSRRTGNFDILESLIGRTNDFAVLPSGKRSAGLTFYYISKALMDSGDTMKEFIIKQTKLHEFVFEYVADTALSEEQKQKVQEALDTYMEPGLVALFERKTTIQRSKSGKLKHFHSLLPPESNLNEGE